MTFSQTFLAEHSPLDRSSPRASQHSRNSRIASGLRRRPWQHRKPRCIAKPAARPLRCTRYQRLHSYAVLERFQAKWSPVRVKKTRQIKNLESRFDSIETEKALGRNAVCGRAWICTSQV